MIRFSPYLFGFALLLPAAASLANNGSEPGAADVLSEGKSISFDPQRGNCLACHAIESGEHPGNIGPPLVNMKERYPNKQRLRAQIWDATLKNPNTIMPPYGRHLILTEDELNKVVDFIHTL
ncbi:MAG: sulfur oxidation c-type cytochrome SoxX [Gammaproteobacteria bacterium]|nr:sulfur oxidation c-type cytochrome SoxX [Gammaproteobacteria bacterium]